MGDPAERYVVIGSAGQLGSDLVRTFDGAGTVIPLTRQQIDILDVPGMRAGRQGAEEGKRKNAETVDDFLASQPEAIRADL